MNDRTVTIRRSTLWTLTACTLFCAGANVFQAVLNARMRGYVETSARNATGAAAAATELADRLEDARAANSLLREQRDRAWAELARLQLANGQPVRLPGVRNAWGIGPE